MDIYRTGSVLTGLIDLINFIPGGVMVEVGCYSGESTVEFAKKFDKVYAVDPWIFIREPHIGVEQCFDNRILEYKNIIKMKMVGDDACIKFEDNSLDFVYVDADHRYPFVKNDILKWLPKVKTGCYFGGHDYYKDTVGVIKAVDEKFGKPLKIFEDNSWIVIK